MDSFGDAGDGNFESTKERQSSNFGQTATVQSCLGRLCGEVQIAEIRIEKQKIVVFFMKFVSFINFELRIPSSPLMASS
jgi:hypothetical protein